MMVVLRDGITSRRIEVVEDRRDLLDPVPFEFYSDGTSRFGRGVVVG